MSETENRNVPETAGKVEPGQADEATPVQEAEVTAAKADTAEPGLEPDAEAEIVAAEGEKEAEDAEDSEDDEDVEEDGDDEDGDDDDEDDEDDDDEEDEDDEEEDVSDDDEGVVAESEGVAVEVAATEAEEGATEVEEVVAEVAVVAVEGETVEVATVALVAAEAAPTVTDVVPPDHAQSLRLLEALIFAGNQALGEKDLAERLPDGADVPQLLAELSELYASRGVNLVKVAGGYAFRTAPDLADKLKIEKPVTRKLSRASIETLAIIAYHQPVTRAEIEQVRGVGLSKGTLDLLFEQNWIKPMGRRRAPGKPVTWGTTDFFLEHFGLPSLDDLPGHEEMKAAGLLDPRAQPPIFRPEEPDLPLEPTEDETVEPLATEEQGQ